MKEGRTLQGRRAGLTMEVGRTARGPSRRRQEKSKKAWTDFYSYSVFLNQYFPIIFRLWHTQKRKIFIRYSWGTESVLVHCVWQPLWFPHVPQGSNGKFWLKKKEPSFMAYICT